MSLNSRSSLLESVKITCVIYFSASSMAFILSFIKVAPLVKKRNFIFSFCLIIKSFLFNKLNKQLSRIEPVLFFKWFFEAIVVAGTLYIFTFLCFKRFICCSVNN